MPPLLCARITLMAAARLLVAVLIGEKRFGKGRFQLVPAPGVAPLDAAVRHLQPRAAHG
ncbi:MAG: hypothetical protein ACR2IK_04335 [Chloroflexota bacterium]